MAEGIILIQTDDKYKDSLAQALSSVELQIPTYIMSSTIKPITKEDILELKSHLDYICNEMGWIKKNDK